MFFDDYELEEKDMLGTEGKGFDQLKIDFNLERLIQPIYHYGLAFCAYEDAVKYANQREAFGKTIGRFQLMQLKIANMSSKLAAMRSLVYESCWKFDKNLLGREDAGICKFFCLDAAFSIIDDAMQIMGGIAVASENRIARAWRDVRCDRMAGGSTEMMVIAIAKSVLKRYK
jgi:crotonobetainyl-CoA dehydrogenase